MDEAVQMDLEDIEDHTQYRDQKCEKLEEILRRNTEFEGCVVKRIRLQKEAPELKDPFDIQDSKGKHIVWFYEWEFDILNESEILSYLGAGRINERKLDSYIIWQLSGFIVTLVGILAVAVVVSIHVLSLNNQLVIGLLPYAIAILGTGILIVIIGARRKQIGLRQLDIDFAKENPSFINALKKLGSLAGVPDSRDYSKRLEYIKSKLNVSNS
jgi:hypothetical protein